MKMYLSTFIVCCICFISAMTYAEEIILMKFKNPSLEPSWTTVNDNVMGGRSTGGYSIDPETGVLTFSGETNTQGGGFSSIRTENKKWKLEGAEGLLFRYRGDGRSYKADLRKAGPSRWLKVAYRVDFKTDASADWQIIRLPFSEFKPTRMGQPVTADAITASDIGSIGFMIYDKKDGPFELLVDYIGVYSDPVADK